MNQAISFMHVIFFKIQHVWGGMSRERKMLAKKPNEIALGQVI